jgi:hypothetical protein
MEDYGFVLLTDSENASIGLGKTNASFEYLYRTMENQGTFTNGNKSDYGKALEMTKEEKTISFLNQYFIFKKARNVTGERLDKLYEKHVSKKDEDSDEDQETKDIISSAVASSSGRRSFLRKIPDKKIVLSIEKYSPIKEENDENVILSEEKEEIVPEEKEKDEDFGEYTEFFQNLKPDVQAKIRNYPQEKQIEILKKLQKPKKKIVTKK